MFWPERPRGDAEAGKIWPLWELESMGVRLSFFLFFFLFFLSLIKRKNNLFQENSEEAICLKFPFTGVSGSFIARNSSGREYTETVDTVCFISSFLGPNSPLLKGL